MSSGSTRCAGCKHLRRKCPRDCILAPYFPPSNPQRFASVHEIFGASNVTKTLEQLPEHLRGDAAESMAYEAMQRMRDPVYGCAGIILVVCSNLTSFRCEQQLPEHLRGDAAESMAYEAMQRMRDPVYGCAGIITQLQQQIIQLKGEISRAESEIARLIASAQQNQPPPLAFGYGVQDKQSFQMFNTGQGNQDDFIISDQHLPSTSF